MSEESARASDTQSFDIRIEVKRLLQFAVGHAEIKISDDIIKRCVVATTTSQGTVAEQEVELWQCYNALAGIIHPATPASVKAITELSEDQIRRSGLFRLWWQDAPARKQIVCAIAWIVLALAPLVGIQFYSIALSSVLENIAKADSQLAEARDRLQIVEQSIAAAAAEVKSLAKQRDALDEEVKYLESVTTASYGMLVKLTGFWVQLISCQAEKSSVCASTGNLNDLVSLQINARNASQAFLKAISLYFLPLLYGLLGANVYILRSVIAKLDAWNLTTIAGSKHQLRRALGALLGATLGLLFDTDKSFIASTGFSLAMVSFLAGYSAEFVFSLFDAVIDRTKETFVPKKDLAAQASAATANTPSLNPPRPPDAASTIDI